MRYRKLGPDNDYSFGHSQKDFWQDVPDAVLQAAGTRLLLWLGEWYLDIEEGTQFMQGILGKYSQTTVDANVQARIAGTQGFVGITSFISSIDPENRSYGFTAVIDTVYGPTVVQKENYGTY